MKVIDHPKQLLLDFKLKGMNNPELLTKFANARLKKINTAFFSNFNAPAFAGNILDKTKSLRSGDSDELPLIAGIPITDFINYATRRIEEAKDPKNNECLSKLVEVSLDLLQIGDIPVMPSSIALASNSNDCGEVYVPTFGEILLSEFAERTYSSLKDSSSMILPLVNRLNEIDPRYGKDSPHLAALGLKLSGGRSAPINDIFSEASLNSGVAYLLENSITTINDFRLKNLINSAKETNLPLGNLCVKDSDLKISTYLKNVGSSDMYDLFDVVTQRQGALSSIESQSHRISNDYDPLAYFDM
ncbi:hypothetical protein BCT01_08640 [Vibrio tasmaniensis]|uniref:hypothetical protein n=1 Tax=Vibrio TaxID=662 RepID=UPI000C82DC8D|nr:hypothetical protein [Vibrio tasmaniensis]PMO80349.1 hypothetical protein BCT01_08640 [Vibrio tasmaniensis]